MRLAAPLLLLATLVSPAAAQSQFEGVIQMTLTSGDKPMPATVYVKGGRARYDMGADADLGGMIMDGQGKTTMLMPKQKSYYVADLGHMLAAAREKMGPTTYVRTGKSETIAGMSCDYYRTTRDKDVLGDSCMTTALGFVGVDLSGKQGLMSDEELAEMRKQFPKGAFPLKVLAAETGKPMFVVTKVERKAVPDDAFRPPAGWTEMTMPGAAAAKGTPPKGK